MLRRKHQALRGMLGHSPSLAISMLALVFALGSGAGYAATTVSKAPNPAPPTLAFHHLKLRRGWLGRAEYAYANGIVYLSGVVSAPDNHTRSPIVAALPRSLAPEKTLDIPISFFDIGDGTLVVYTNGALVPFSPQKNGYRAVSLAGVSFAAGAP